MKICAFPLCSGLTTPTRIIFLYAFLRICLRYDRETPAPSVIFYALSNGIGAQPPSFDPLLPQPQNRYFFTTFSPQLHTFSPSFTTSPAVFLRFLHAYIHYFLRSFTCNCPYTPIHFPSSRIHTIFDNFLHFYHFLHHIVLKTQLLHYLRTGFHTLIHDFLRPITWKPPAPLIFIFGLYLHTIFIFFPSFVPRLSQTLYPLYTFGATCPLGFYTPMHYF